MFLIWDIPVKLIPLKVKYAFGVPLQPKVILKILRILLNFSIMVGSVQVILGRFLKMDQ